MSVLTSVGILLFSMLIMASLQLVPGIFLLFSHFATGKYSRVKSADLIIFFILGAETAVTFVFLCVYSILCASPGLIPIIDSEIAAWVTAGIFVALSIAAVGLYYRKGSGTRLFISRRLAQGLRAKFPTIKSRSDAFTLGLTSTIPELVFTLPLYFVSAIAIMRLDLSCPGRAGTIILFAIIAILPLLIFRSLSHVHNSADFIRFRFQSKPFFRYFISLCYLLIAVLITLGVIL